MVGEKYRIKVSKKWTIPLRKSPPPDFFFYQVLRLFGGGIC
jgi:hypothetical protein